MTLQHLLQTLSDRSITVWIDNGRIGYQAPAGALSDDLRRAIQGLKADLTAHLRTQEIDGSLTRGVDLIPVVSRSGPLVLSEAQEGFWFLDQLRPTRGAFNVCRAFRLSGRLDAGALQSALDQSVARHEAVRTTFASGEEGPIPRIHSPMTVQLRMGDLAHWAEAGQRAELDRILEAEAVHPLVLSKAPLMRALLVKLGGTEHVLMITAHHIVVDAWSMTILWRELFALYQARVDGAQPSLAPLRIQFADWASWQRLRSQSPRVQDDVKYWTQQLAGAPPVLELPADRPRPAIPRYRGSHQLLRIPEHLTAQLRELGRGQGATLFMTLLAGWKALLHHYAGTCDIVVAAPVAGRSTPETENLVGCFVNPLVLRTSLTGDPSFSELLRRVRTTSLGGYAHQDAPFERVVEAMDLIRDPRHHPVFQVLFSMQSFPGSGATRPLRDISCTPHRVHQRASKLDLTLNLTETGSGLDGSIEYDTELFDEDRIRRMAGHFLELLHSVVSEPSRVLSRLSWVTAAERHQHLIEWNGTRVAHPGAACIHDLIEEQAARVPEREAVASQGVTLTYRELNRRATAAAHVLREAGAGPEVLVGVCMERSVELVVALLGILKTGRAYVPLDILQPRARLDALAHEAGLKHIVVDAHGRRHLEGANEASLVPTELWSSSLEGACRSEHGPSDPDNLAYTLFTSGTTGKPKGVQVSHRSVVNLLRSMRDRLGVLELDTVLGVTNLSFDIAGLELWLPLILGAKLVLASRQTAADPEALAREILEVSVVQATPATWGMLRDAGCVLSPRVMRLCGGESLPTDLAEYLAADGAAAWNLYGPTETTIWSTASRLEAQPRKVVTIGTPIANTRTYIVDSHLEPRPVGLAGELLIGGAGVARGYLNEPGLTAERFIPDPFSAEPGQRLYRTGDIVRHGIDGHIEHLGRSDHQVKIRGFRIEVAEVESALLGHPEVKSALVLARTDQPGETKLVAYLVPRGPTTVAGKDLRAWVSQKLPDYMVPAHAVWLDAFPLSPNGKIDRKALPLPVADHEPAEPAGAAPRTPLELVVAQAWKEALRVDQVTLDDDFFDLGGHSLSATKVVSRLRKSLAREVPIHLLFEFTTLGDFTRHLSSLEPTTPTRST